MSSGLSLKNISAGSMRSLWSRRQTDRAEGTRGVWWGVVRLRRKPLQRPPPGLQRWWRSPGRGRPPSPSSGPPPSSTSCACSGTRSWCGARWGWGSAPAPRASASRCSGWKGTPSRAPAAGRACTQSSCVCFLHSQSSRMTLKPHGELAPFKNKNM